MQTKPELLRIADTPAATFVRSAELIYLDQIKLNYETYLFYPLIDFELYGYRANQ